MPRAGWRKPVSDRRLSDLVSVGVLTRVFPPDVVDEVIAAAGRAEQRNRRLPARVMAYFAIGMALYSEGSYADVLSQLTDGLAWASGWADSYRPPSKSAIFQARARLGPEPVAALFARVAKPLASATTAGSWLAGRRLVAVDGTCLDVADTGHNAGFFGRPGVAKGEQAAFFADALCATSRDRLSGIADLRRAVDRHEFSLRFQPVKRLDGTAIIGAEALLRWEHPERGTVSPEGFISLGEETGLIIPIGDGS